MSQRHDTIARDSNVNILLHDAVRAYEGARFAEAVSDTPAAADLDEKAKRLLSKAISEDPDRVSPAWDEARKSSEFLRVMGE